MLNRFPRSSLSTSRRTVTTWERVRICIPRSLAVPSRQSAMVRESSVVGNIRPSDSALSSTPRRVNHL
eukprot:scaffold2830_cov395-Prasinococcus_capsulatus_cf.AAC.3